MHRPAEPTSEAELRAFLEIVQSDHGLSDDQIDTACAIVRTATGLMFRFIKVWVGALFVVGGGLILAELATGFRNEALATVLFALAFFLPMLIFFTRRNKLRMAIESLLRCRSCRRPLGGTHLQKVRDERLCPFCGQQTPLSAAPRADA
jgi:hypothetical protein